MSWARILLLLLAALPAAAQEPNRVFLRPLWSEDEHPGTPAVEQRILEMVNDERRRRDIPELRPLTALQVAARQHSREMVLEDYFAHDAPHDAWREPGQRAWRAGYWEAFVAENIAFVRLGGGGMATEELARWFMYSRDGWMNSPPHRANILDPQYTHLGVGVFSRGGTHMATQVFGVHYYDFHNVALEQRGNDWVVWGRARLLRETGRVYFAVDSELVGNVAVKRGESFGFSLRIPRDGGLHKVGLHPAKDARSYWIKYVFYVDTGRPLAEALVPPPG